MVCQRCGKERRRWEAEPQPCLKCGRLVCSNGCRSRIQASRDIGFTYQFLPLCRDCDTNDVRKVIAQVRAINSKAKRERERLLKDWAFLKRSTDACTKTTGSGTSSVAKRK